MITRSEGRGVCVGVFFELAYRSEGSVSKSSHFLGDPPPDPRFLASLAALSLLDPCCILEILTGWSSHRLSSLIKVGT